MLAAAALFGEARTTRALLTFRQQRIKILVLFLSRQSEPTNYQSPRSRSNIEWHFCHLTKVGYPAAYFRSIRLALFRFLHYRPDCRLRVLPDMITSGCMAIGIFRARRLKYRTHIRIRYRKPATINACRFLFRFTTATGYTYAKHKRQDNRRSQ